MDKVQFEMIYNQPQYINSYLSASKLLRNPFVLFSCGCRRKEQKGVPRGLVPLAGFLRGGAP